MRTFKESEKSQKTVKSMIETKGGDKGKEQGGKKNKNAKKEGKCCQSCLFYMIAETVVSVLTFSCSHSRASQGRAEQDVTFSAEDGGERQPGFDC